MEPALLHRGCVLKAVVFAVYLGAGAASQAHAQSSSAPVTSPVYIQAGPVMSVHGEGEQYHRTSPALSDLTLGLTASIGVDIAPRASVEVDLLVDGKQSAPLVDSYTSITEFTAESRDLAFGMNLRLRPRAGSPIEFVVGGGIARTTFARRDIVGRPLFPPRPPQRSPDTTESTVQPTAAASMAVVLGVNPRLAIVPSIGVRWIVRETIDSEAWYFGVGRFSLVASAALRFRP